MAKNEKLGPPNPKRSQMYTGKPSQADTVTKKRGTGLIPKTGSNFSDMKKGSGRPT